jgi:hypothetical protein
MAKSQAVYAPYMSCSGWNKRNETHKSDESVCHVGMAENNDQRTCREIKGEVDGVSFETETSGSRSNP